jgi:ketosteroid isomerase-like protein
MKKLLFNALFIGLATLGFAQTPFTEKTVQDINKRFIENPTNDDTAPDYVLTGSEGQKIGMEQLNKMFPNVKHLTWETTDMTIKQYGKVAIVNGITKHSFVTLNDNVTHAYHVRGTYVYEFQKDKWRKVSAHHTNIMPTQASEEAAIKKVLVDERNAFYAGDKDGMAKFWTNNAHTFVNASYPNGNQFYMNNEVVQKSISNFKPNDNAVGAITSSKVKIYGNNAVADLEQTTTHKNGSVHKEHNIVLLEKEADAWKVMGYSVHGLQKDKKEDSVAVVKVIEKETQSWHDRDADGRIACVANVPYTVMLVHHGVITSNNGVAYATNEKTNAPEAIKTQTAGMGKPNGSSFKNNNYVVTIRGGTAFVSYDETTTAADGTKQYAHAVRNLERIDGLWKLTYIGGVFYKP